MSEYKIGFWNYMPLERHHEKMVDEWIDLGLNYAMSPFYVKGKTDRERFVALLDECGRKGIDLVVKDTRVEWKRVRELGEDAYRENVRDFVRDFGSYKSVHSMFVGDEPKEEEMEYVEAACRIIREEGNGIKAYLAVMTPVAMDIGDLEKMMVKLIRNGRLEYIVYNCYSQCMSDKEQRHQGIESYFKFLNMFRKISEQCRNIPVWMSIIASGHWFYRSPTPDDMRWQLNVAAAYGIKGFVWFNVYEYFHWYGGAAHDYPVNHWGDRMPAFAYMRNENKTFLEFVAPLFGKSVLKKVYMHWEYWIPMGGTPMFMKDADEIVSDVRDTYNHPILISRFEDDKKLPVVTVANVSQEEHSSVYVSFKGEWAKYNKHIFLMPGEVYVFTLRDAAGR